MGLPRSPSEIEEEIGRLADLPRDALVESWVKAHGHPPPKGCKRGLLERDHAYRLQARVFGGLKPATRKKLLAIARGMEAKSRAKATEVRTGTRFVREWHGRTHHVEVMDEGCLWNGDLYPSLSAIARAITGARWSGPRFFGL